MGFWGFLGVVWFISPIVLVPFLVHYVKKSSALEKENRRLFNGTRFEAGNNVCVPLEKEVKAQPVFPSTALESQPISFLAGSETVKKVSKPETVPASKMETEYVSAPHKENKGTALFGIGVFFVLLAGVIFATTTWNILPVMGKVFTLLAAVVVFFVSSYIAKEKLDLRETGITFFFLGSCFLSVINISIAYFKWFSESYSFTGNTSFLVLSVSLFILTICLAIGKKIYDMPVLEIVSLYLSIVAVLLLTLSLTKSFGLIMAIMGAYLWIVFGLLYYVQYLEGNTDLIKAMRIPAVIFQTAALFAIFSDSYCWAAPVVLIALAMFLPQMYLDEEHRDGYIIEFDIAVVLYFLLIMMRSRVEFDFSITAILIFGAQLLGIALNNINLPKIGKIKSKISGWCTIFILLISSAMILTEGLIYEVISSQPSHMIHLYVVLLLSAGISLIKIIKGKEESDRERVLFFAEVCVSFLMTGWIDPDYYLTENIIAFVLVLGFYFLWLIKLRKDEESSVGILLAAVSILGGLPVLILCIIEAYVWEMALVIVLLGFLYYLLDKNKHIYAGIFPMLMIFALSDCLLDYVKLPANEDLWYGIIYLGIMVIMIALGRTRYRMLRDNREGREGIDWMGVCAVLFAVDGMTYCFETGLLALALYLLSYYKRTAKNCWQIMVTLGGGVLGYLLCVQSFVAIPDIVEKEFAITVVFLFLIFAGFVWREKLDVYACIASIAMFLLMLVYAIDSMDKLMLLESEKQSGYIGMIAFFLTITLVVGVIGHFIKNRVFVICCGLLLIISSLITGCLDNLMPGIIVLAIGVLYGIYLGLGKKKIWFVLPVLEMYLFLLVRNDVAWYVWLAVYLVSMGIGLGFYRKIFRNEDGVREADYFTLFSIIPTIAILTAGTLEWAFCGKMMLAFYVLSMYKRLGGELLDRAVLCLSSAVVFLAIITQPFFTVPRAWKTEWILFWLWATVLFNAIVVFKENRNDGKYLIMFIFAIASVILQGVEAIDTGRAVDAIILSVCMAGLLIYSFFTKRKAWFLLAAISLVVQGIYASRAFWLSIAWWVYILAVGVIFIAVAAWNEYNKRNNTVKEKRALLSDWSMW